MSARVPHRSRTRRPCHELTKRYLSPDERRRAVLLSKSLRSPKSWCNGGERDVAVIRRQMQQEIENVGGVQIQYIAFVADGTLTPVERIDGPTTIALAATVGNTRLIDNIVIGRQLIGLSRPSRPLTSDL